MPRIIIDGHIVEYDIHGPYINTQGAEVIRFYSENSQGETLDVMACRLEGETDNDMAARVFACIRMA